jgi:hypothetical protein
MAAAKVFADAYPVTIDFYVDGIRRHTHLVSSLDAFRLPRVSEVIMATTMTELSATV